MRNSTLMRIIGLGIISTGIALGASGAKAALFDLNKEQIAEAVAFGKKNFEMHPTAFMWPYYKNTGFGYPATILRTEYYSVADYVRRSEFQRKYGSQRAHKLTDKRIESERSQSVGVLEFIVTIYGPTADFMKDYGFFLMTNGKKVTPKSVDMPAVATSSGFAGKLAYSSNVIVDFPRDGLRGNEKITLIVKPPKGQGPSGARNTSFKVPYDLGLIK